MGGDGARGSRGGCGNFKNPAVECRLNVGRLFATLLDGLVEKVGVPAEEIMDAGWPKVVFVSIGGAAVHAGDGGEEAAELGLVWGGAADEAGVHGSVVVLHVECLQDDVGDKVADMPGRPVGVVHVFTVAVGEERYTGEVEEVVGA